MRDQVKQAQQETVFKSELFQAKLTRAISMTTAFYVLFYVTPMLLFNMTSENFEWTL